jgi:hypothetical protein
MPCQFSSRPDTNINSLSPLFCVQELDNATCMEGPGIRRCCTKYRYKRLLSMCTCGLCSFVRGAGAGQKQGWVVKVGRQPAGAGGQLHAGRVAGTGGGGGAAAIRPPVVSISTADLAISAHLWSCSAAAAAAAAAATYTSTPTWHIAAITGPFRFLITGHRPLLWRFVAWCTYTRRAHCESPANILW